MVSCSVGSGSLGCGWFGSGLHGLVSFLGFWLLGWVSSVGWGCLVCLVLWAAVLSLLLFSYANVFGLRLVQVPMLQAVTVSVPFGSFCMLKMASS